MTGFDLPLSVAPDAAGFNPAKFAAMIPAAADFRATRRAEWITLALCGLAAAGFIALAATNNARIIQSAARFERLWRSSPANQTGRGACTGIARAAPPLMFDPDAYCWIALTQEHQRQGALRVNAFAFDNAPFGREVHWSSGLEWWLWLVGAVDHLATGQPMETAIAESALWANPLLFALALLALALAFRRALGAWATGILLITFASLWGVQWDFSYGRPDHHGLHLIAFAGLALCAMAGGFGWVSERTAAGARAWFAASGLFGAMGLWLGAVQQCMGIGALGAGATAAALAFARPGQGPGHFAPELWRRWARFGAAGSIAFFLLEYFPGRLAMRLEVNHPLYALAWLGGGELMWIIGRCRVDGRMPRGSGARGALGLAALAALPAVALAGPRDWCVLTDPWIKHVFGIASEGRPWLQGLPLPAMVTQAWEYTGALLLTLPLGVAILLLTSRGAPPERRAAILTLLPVAALFLGWTLLQNRWMGFLETSLAVLALAIARCLPGRRRGGALPVGLLALTVPGWAAYCALQCRALADDPLHHARALLTDAAAVQEISWNLRLLAPPGERPARVMSPFGASPLLHHFGGVQTVGSFYWENLPGARAGMDFYNDKGGAASRRIARERGLDYVLAIGRPAFVFELQIMQIGHPDEAAARGTLAYRLANPLGATPPPWLERVELRDAPLADHEGYRLYRVIHERLGD